MPECRPVIRFKVIVCTVAAAVLLVVLAGVAVVVKQTYWIRNASVTEIPDEPAAIAMSPAAQKAAILRSDASANSLRSGQGYESHPQYWRDLLAGAGWKADVVSDADLRQGIGSYSLLVLPSAVCLDEQQRRTIREFLSQGKGVIATWATGVRKENGDWIGWDFLQELTHADAFDFSDRPGPWYIAFADGNPVSAGMAAGKRIQVSSLERVEATTLSIDAYWSNFRLFPADSRRPAIFLGSILHNQLGRGRVVWFGFQENSATGSPDKAILDAVLLNAAVWAGGGLVVNPAPWPSGYNSAVLMALNLDKQPANAGYAAETLLRKHARGSFYCAGDQAQNDRTLLQVVSSAGELGSHGWQHSPLPANSRWQTLYELARAKRELERASGAYVSGLFPSYDTLPEAAIPALAASRHRYFIGSGEGLSVLPQVLRISGGRGFLRRESALVRLIRMGDDDLSLSPLGLTGLDQDWVVQRVLADADVLTSLGGLYVFSYHSQGLSAPEYAPALGRLVQTWQDNHAWVATGADIANWWLKRQELSVGSAASGDGTTRLNVRYTGAEPIEGVVLNVYGPSGVAGVSINAVAGAPKPAVEPDPDRARVRLRLPRLARGTYTYEIRGGALAP